jgi:predicted DCC family thiol-disulfide oxidoreductase YuxK
MTTSTLPGSAAGASTLRSADPVLLYDENCSVCRRFISLLINADQRGAMRIAPLQSPLGDAIREAYPEYTAKDSALWIGRDGEIRAYSDAILASLDYLGGPWTALTAAMRVVPVRFRDAAYRTFAENRNLFGRLGLTELDSNALERMLKEPETRAVASALRSTPAAGSKR